MALTNHSVTGVRTVYLPCRADRGFISSRFVREIARYGGAVTHMVPQPVADALAELYPPDDLRMTYDDDNYDDEYDEYDEIDDEYPEPGQGYVGDAETLLRRSIDIIATAPTMPLSSSPRIDRDEIIELLEEALQRLPDELRQARWMLKERQEFVAKTRREADELLEAARVRAERMVQRTEVVRAAEQRARQVMETAEADSRRLRHETEDFLDQRLGSFEILLDKLQKTVGAGRQRLSIGAVPTPARRRRGGRPHQGVLRPGPVRRWPARAARSRQRRRAAAPARHPPPHRRRRRRSPTLDVDDPRLAGDVAVDVTRRVDARRHRRHRHAHRRLARHLPALPAPARRAAGRRRRRALRASPGDRRVDPEAFPIEHGQLDLGPMVREEVLLGVPDAPLCRDDCPGLCPVCGADLHADPCDCDTAVRDERWAALDQLRLDE